MRPLLVLLLMALPGCTSETPDGRTATPGENPPDGPNETINQPGVEPVDTNPYLHTACDATHVRLSIGSAAGNTGDTPIQELGDRAGNVTFALLELLINSQSPLEQRMHATVYDDAGTIADTDEASDAGTYRIDIPVDSWNQDLKLRIEAANGGIIHEADIDYCLTTSTQVTLDNFTAF